MYIAMGGSSDGYFDAGPAPAASPPERDPAVVAANPDLGGHRALPSGVEDLAPSLQTAMPTSRSPCSSLAGPAIRGPSRPTPGMP